MPTRRAMEWAQDQVMQGVRGQLKAGGQLEMLRWHAAAAFRVVTGLIAGARNAEYYTGQETYWIDLT